MRSAERGETRRGRGRRSDGVSRKSSRWRGSRSAAQRSSIGGAEAGPCHPHDAWNNGGVVRLSASREAVRGLV